MRALWEADELARALGVERGFAVSGVSIDTRTLVPGDLFVALQGERDGHEFVPEAFEKGAAAALVSRKMPGDVVVVEDGLAGLRRLAAAARARGRAKAVAVTGSVGKTTAKEMLRVVLGAFGKVHAAEASFNNHIGVPLTLARMGRDADFGVFEIGMNHAGEIAPLAGLVRPDVAVITRVGRAHIGLMGSEAAIAAEKAEIFSGLVAGGTAVMPAESRFLALLRAKAGGHQVTFGGGGDARLLKVKAGAQGSDISAFVGGVGVKFRLQAAGMHMAENALAVLAAAGALGLDVGLAAEALEGFSPVGGRGARQILRNGAVLLDESYNASGASMRAALAVLRLQAGRRVAVLGDMLELGDHAAAEHLGLLPAVVGGADVVFACGAFCRALFDSLPQGMQGGYMKDAASLAPMVRAAVRAGDTVLVKGSYGSRMRDVVKVLEDA